MIMSIDFLIEISVMPYGSPLATSTSLDMLVHFA